MELESQNGSKITLQKNPNTPIQVGRNSLSQTPDKTVSRHHITLNYNTQKGILKFVVYGKNPIWVHEFHKDEIKVYRRGDKGNMKVGDEFCVGGKDFVWFKVREIDDDVKMELGGEFGEIGESLGGESESLGGGDVSDVDDPVKGTVGIIAIVLPPRPFPYKSECRT
ncbi:Forkhead-associated (FHA) domain-containing protein [Artemisia annua]|uniref:Forkhead-associated (FHA) domain-containing protein n=1 Tax=Artemisia annua TaxID=35608 RepID=A0A2U1Q9D0_ARTAN|nr:Forkhead-associated (FHA) domain-containing protein [Artemisia annua]